MANKPRGYFEYILAMDCETTGLAYNSDDPSYDPVTHDEYQAISWGLVVANASTLIPIEELYLEVKWDPRCVWSSGAEKVHGLSREYLEENGVPEADAAVLIANLIVKYWGTNSVRTLGHNVATFDVWFMKRLMRKFGIEIPFGNRHVDTSSIGFVNYSVYTSDQLFELMGYDTREKHNALDDAHMSLGSARMTRMAMAAALEG